MLVCDSWKDYEVIKTSKGEKLEKWKDIVLLRPDPQIIWDNGNLDKNPLINAHYIRESTGGGHWEFKKNMPEEWIINWKNLKFKIKPMGFKHTGLFPEQAGNWEQMIDFIKKADREIKILNLFAYTGGASIACASAGGKVTQVDASKGMTLRAKENAELNNINSIRFIVDDCEKFIKREIKRGNKYDAILMDPPSYGRGPSGETWKLEDNLFNFLKLTKEILSDRPLFVLINSYTTGLAPTVLANLLKLVFEKDGAKGYELCLPTKEGIFLPCGASGMLKWE